MKMRVGSPVAVTARAAESGPCRLTAEQQRRAEGDAPDFGGTFLSSIAIARAAFDRLVCEIGGEVRRLQPSSITHRQRRGCSAAEQQRCRRNQEAGWPLASIHRLNSSASAHPKVHKLSSFASM